MKKDSGITLVTLAVTILIIIILAGVTINATLGDNGLLKQAQDAKNLAESTTSETEDKMEEVLQEYKNVMAEDESINNPNTNTEPEDPVDPPESETPTVEDSKNNGIEFKEDTEIEDVNGNKIIVPEGFKIASDSGNTVQQGIVIEDVSASRDANVQGSQFVWIPVGKFIKDYGTEVNIILGRYTFDKLNGTPSLQQAAYTTDNPKNYENSVVIESYFSEIAGAHRDGTASNGLDGLNATAKNLADFVDSVKENRGYYIGRYEASFASGTSVDNYKAASKVSTSYTNSMSVGRLWTGITQLDASKVAINTYNGTTIESDLMNSYAWDTAIVYMQESGYTNYANRISVNSNLTNTGTIGDEACNINDMASNLTEWTTEYSNDSNGSNYAWPSTCRGGDSIRDSYYEYTAERQHTTSNYTGGVSYNGFRLCLYIK